MNIKAYREFITKTKRIDQIIALRKIGLTLDDIGEIHEISKERVRQIILKGNRSRPIPRKNKNWVPDDLYVQAKAYALFKKQERIKSFSVVRDSDKGPPRELDNELRAWEDAEDLAWERIRTG